MAIAPSTGQVQSWEQFLARIDRRFIYIGLFLFTLFPLVLNISLPVYVTPPIQSFYETIENAPQDKLIFVSSNWDAGTFAENEPQALAFFRHLMRRRLKFIIISASNPNAPQMAQNTLQAAIRAEFPGWKPGDYPVYGTDYVNAGYKIQNTPWVRSLVRDTLKALETDWKGKPLKGMPVCEGLAGIKSRVSTLVDLSASSTIERWIALVGPEGVEICLACTAVMAPEQYPLLASRQLAGMLTGMRGAAEYEKLLKIEKGRAGRMMGGQSFAHLYLFLLIGFGNLAIIKSWFARRRAGR